MTAEVQSLAALAVVTGAALYVARRAWSTWRAARLADEESGPGCGSGCDCH